MFDTLDYETTKNYTLEIQAKVLYVQSRCAFYVPSCPASDEGNKPVPACCAWHYYSGSLPTSCFILSNVVPRCYCYNWVSMKQHETKWVVNCSSSHPSIHPSIYSIAHSSIHPSTHPFIQLFIYSSTIHSYIHLIVMIIIITIFTQEAYITQGWFSVGSCKSSIIHPPIHSIYIEFFPEVIALPLFCRMGDVTGVWQPPHLLSLKWKTLMIYLHSFHKRPTLLKSKRTQWRWGNTSDQLTLSSLVMCDLFVVEQFRVIVGPEYVTTGAGLGYSRNSFWWRYPWFTPHQSVILTWSYFELAQRSESTSQMSHENFQPSMKSACLTGKCFCPR